MRRPRTAVLVAVAVVLFLAVSAELARFLTAASRERDAVYGLLVDQARGDAPAMLGRLDGCRDDARCTATVNRNAARLRRPGAPKILSFDSPTAYALGERTGRARVAWAIVERDGLPVVQCVTIRHRFSLTGGAEVRLRSLSAPIGNEKGC